jgi:hypothetical protein
MGVSVRVDEKAVADDALGFQRGKFQRFGTAAAPRDRAPAARPQLARLAAARSTRKPAF